MNEKARTKWKTTIGKVLLVCAVLAITSATVLECRHEEVLLPAEVIYPDTFALYSVRSESDVKHKTPLTTPDGTVWYREEEAGLDLLGIKRDDIDAIRDPDGPGGLLILRVKPEVHRELSAWARARIGNSTVFVYRGEAIGKAVPLEHELPRLLFEPVSTYEKASWLAEEIRDKPLPP